MDFARSLAFTVAQLVVAGVEISIQESRNSCFVDMNRNKIIAEFLKTDCTHALFIDDDMGWPPEVVAKMIAQDVEFIAAIGPTKVETNDGYACQIFTNPDQTPKVVNGLISASRVGAAFMLLKRSMLEKMVKAYPERRSYVVDAEQGYRFFQVEHTQNLFMTEDYVFCDLWRKTGGEIWIYPDVDFTHTGVKDFKGNYHKFLLGDLTEPVKKEAEGIGVRYSVVIVSYKAPEVLEKCLRSLAANPPKGVSEIILVDNSPEPIEIAPTLLKELDSEYLVKLLHNSENVGFAEACNIGVRHSEGEYLTFVNPDTEVFPGWAESLSAHLTDGVGAAGPLSNFVASLQNITYYRGISENEDWAALADGLTHGGIHRGVEAKLLIGFFLMVPRMVWDKVGEFDPALILGCDDLDYSLRLQQAGFKLKIAPDVFVFHKGHASFEAESKSLEMNQKSEAVMRAKLKALYRDKIPSSMDLWGCDIFPTGGPIEA